ncbi:hypothetical protein YenMTG1_028 [Yersinia phage vB_YenM_TG1]|uniref:Uncharacterized protein n=1 Tax=Yersinia phage vB_YenM_TG1 TaxID=1589265 RepID=A0A0B4ZX03_9CAUD|nr:Mrh transcription modulator under heat shock [Yersinia phage vB_YenM_TG1]AJD81837.1 hypothetical protein YenMTG1_028 [Yersinia phage vB_YenM_TG1]
MIMYKIKFSLKPVGSNDRTESNTLRIAIMGTKEANKSIETALKDLKLPVGHLYYCTHFVNFVKDENSPFTPLESLKKLGYSYLREDEPLFPRNSSGNELGASYIFTHDSHVLALRKRIWDYLNNPGITAELVPEFQMRLHGMSHEAQFNERSQWPFV